MRKKYLGAFLCLMLFIFSGCTAEILGESRVYEDRFTFTASEFKELYNESVSKNKKISSFDEGKIGNHEIYNSYAIFDIYNITATTDTSGGKITKVQYEYKGGVEFKSTPYELVKQNCNTLVELIINSLPIYKVWC